TLNVRLGIVPSREAAKSLPDSYDPLVVSGDEISIASILEDELILALPIVAMHEIENCSQGKASGSENLEQEAGQENMPSSKRENPFAVLAQLKKNQP
ncbi:MAG: YceD family protein, partial [Gammaproteobacteria bacterium]